MKEVLGAAYHESLARRLAVIRPVKGSESKFKRFARASDLEEMGDYNAEITFALIFVGLGFEVEFEPLGDKGPDLLVARDNQAAYVEVKRFRASVESENTVPEALDDDLIFRPYGNPQRDMAKVRAELLKKFRQVQGGNGIIAFWSDNNDLEDLEFAFGVMDVRTDAEKDIQRLPVGLLFSVFASRWTHVRKHQQIYCCPVRSIFPPFTSWIAELQETLVADAIRVANGRLNPP